MIIKTYSQAGQDLWVLSLFPDGYRGTFIDIGCQLPDKINNTLLLEENGWDGISFDIIDYSKEWEMRSTRFICADARMIDYSIYELPPIIDYLSLDINLYGGIRFEALKHIINSGLVFNVITIEHDVYRGYDESERIPQRKLLKESGYELSVADIAHEGFVFEDWWINKNFKINERI